ncbi:DUF922 domain-containing protein [Hymenobacter edaphi]|uniref:DUF922 domain-containing protein n=1 Tax=Hymenobacter edaphi TaxID=2211146 RepID=A0A328BMI2_9BACT|nr:hypothetical protein [Hymenobacter edaphi]RAK68177.1 hypothetical protein DLM85_09065 [Hymenobacter edaphi]
MKRIAAAVWLTLSLPACAPSVVVKTTAPAAQALPEQEGFVVVKATEPFEAPAQELGTIQIRDAGLSVDCEYETVVALASARARQLGANVLRIDEHRPPSPLGSTCHRLRARALRVADVTPYEKELLWHPLRPLRRADFKGSPANRPFEAATNSGIRYHYAGRLYTGAVQLSIETYFDCQNSYFKGTRDAEQTLAHEQLHFDISEVYARQLTRRFQEQTPDTRELTRRQDALYQQVMTECQTLQDQYDSEVYADRSRQAAWRARIDQELRALQAYAAKQLSIKIKV